MYALEQLLPKLVPTVDLPKALQRGRYMKAIARMERAGIPVDRALLEALQTHRRTIQDQFIAAINPTFHVYDGHTFKIARFDQWLHAHGIHDWPRTATGMLSLKDAVFDEMGQRYPADLIVPIDLERFRVSPILIPKLMARHRQPRKYHGSATVALKGPIPMNWLEHAARLPGKTFLTGVVLWFLAGGLSKHNPMSVVEPSPFKPESTWLRRFGIGRKTAYRALRRFEGTGWIRLDRRAGQTPLITLVVPDEHP